MFADRHRPSFSMLWLLMLACLLALAPWPLLGEPSATQAAPRSSALANTTPAANLSITQSVSPGNVSPGGAVTYTLRPNNGGPASLQSAAWSFDQPGAIGIPDSGNGSPYPSTINIGGLQGTITQVTVNIWNFNHTFPSDVDILLQSPAGKTVVLMADTANGDNVSGVNLGFADNAGGTIPVGQTLSSGTYRPTGGSFSGSPGGPHGTQLSTLNGESPNGGWDLYVFDDAGSDTGSIAGGWTITIATSNAVTVKSFLPPGSGAPTIASNGWGCLYDAPTHSVTCTRADQTSGSMPTIDLTVSAPSAPGTITNRATINSSVPDPTESNNSSFISARVNPVADLTVTKSDSADPVTAGSNFSYSLVVNNSGPTGLPSSFENRFGIKSPVSGTGPGIAELYPSPIDVASLNGTITKVTVSLVGFSHSAASDIDILLEAPGGQKVVLMGDAGAATSNATITFDDSAAGDLPAKGNVINSGTYQPTNYFEGGEIEPDEWPGVSGSAGTFGTALSQLNGLNPNGSWKLYVYDDDINDIGTFSGGWSLSITTSEAIRVVDTLPAQVTYTGFSGSGWSCSGTTTITCTRTSLPSGNAPTLTLNVTAPSEGATLSNMAQVFGPLDTNGNNNVDIEGTTVRAVANLAVSKTDSADPVEASSSYNYIISVSNAGPSTATSVRVTDTLPLGVSLISATGTGWTCSAPPATTVVCTKASLAASGSSENITLSVTAPNEGGSITNNVRISSAESDPNTTNNNFNETTTINARADLSLSKRDAPDPVFAGRELTYTLTITNTGPSTASSVQVIDDLPAGTSFKRASGSGWTCVYDGPSHDVTCSRNTYAVGTSTITIVVDAPASGGSISNSASVNAATPDQNSANNAASTSTVVQPRSELSLTKGDAPDPVNADTALAYTLTASNAGPSVATGVSVVDELPVEVTFLNTTGTDASWSCAYNPLDRKVTCSRATLAVGTAPPIVINVRSGVEGGLITNSASVFASEQDSNAIDNVAVQNTTVVAQSNLRIAKSDTPDPVDAGAALTYTLTVTNDGPSTAASVQVVDTLPPQLTSVITATGSGWSCIIAAGSVTCSRPTLAVGAAPAITIRTIAPPEGGSYNNSASVSSATADPATGNNSVTIGTTVSARADVSIVKSDSADPVNPQSALSYLLKVRNDGPSTASTLRVTDTLPLGFVFGSISTSSWLCVYNSGPHQVVCTLPASLGVAQAPDITISGTTWQRGGTLSNAAIVTTATRDHVPGNNSDVETTYVRHRADLSISKADSPDPLILNTILQYTLTITNAGISQAPAVTVTDVLPASVSFSSASPSTGSCARSGQTVSCFLGTMEPGAVESVVILVRPNQAGTIVNSASVTSTAEIEPNPANNTASASTTVIERADLSLAKGDAPDPVDPLQPLVYTLTVGNNGPNDARAITLTDTLPAGVSFISTSAPGWSCAGTTTIICTRPSLIVGSTSTITINTTAPADGGDYLNSASVSSAIVDASPGNNNASASTRVRPISNLSLVKDDTADPVFANSTLTYTLNLSNAGPSLAGSVKISDTLPAGTTFLSASGSGWSCVPGATVVCSRGSLPVGSAPVVTLVVLAPSDSGTITNTASAGSSSFDPDPDDASSSETTTVLGRANLVLAKSASPTTVTARGTITYTLSIQNNGPSSATSVQVVDTLPAGVSFTSASGAGWNCSGNSSSVTCNRASLGLGPAPAITIVVQAPAQGGTIVNSATISSATADPIPSNNTGTAEVSVTPRANLQISKSTSQSQVNAGAPFSYTLSILNNGPSVATTLRVTDTLPAGLTFVSASGSGWGCSGTTMIVCTLVSLGAGQSSGISINVIAPQEGTTLNNTATVGSATPDPVAANNSSSISTQIVPVAGISLAKSASAGQVDAGAPLTYTLSVSNAGPSSAADLLVSDPLPPGTALISAAGSGWSCSGTTTISCSRTSLAPGAAPAITIVVSAPQEPGTITNTATLSASTGDPGDDDNSASAVTSVQARANLAIVKSISPSTVDAGAPLTYTLSVSNAGPSTASDISVADTLPLSVTLQSISAPGWSCSGTTTISCSLPGLAVGAAPPIVIVAQAPAETATLTNTASVSAATSDPITANNSSTVVSGVSPRADLAIIKSDSADPVLAGAPLTYTLSVSNAGPSTASNISVADTLPAGVTLRGISAPGWSCSGTTTISCSRASLTPGTSSSIEIAVSAPAEATTLSNSASVSAATPDPSGANNLEGEQTGVTAHANLSVSKSASPSTVNASALLTYTLSVSNAGPSTASAIVVSDTLPLSVTLQSISAPGWSCSGTTTISCSRASLGAGASSSISVVVRAPAEPTSLVNSASVGATTIDLSPANNSATINTSVAASADLSIVKLVSTSTITAGQRLTYTLQIANLGPSSATTVQVVDGLPTGMVLLSASGAGWSCGGSVAITCTRAGLPVGSAPDITLVVNAPSSAGPVTNGASIDAASADPNMNNNSSFAFTQVTTGQTPRPVADVTVAGLVSLLDGTIVYTFTVANMGSSTATGVVLNDRLDPGVQVTFATTGCIVSSGLVSCPIGVLLSGTSRQFVIRGAAASSAGNTIGNTAVARANELDPNTQNNTLTQYIEVELYRVYLPLLGGEGSGGGSTAGPDLLASIALVPPKLSFTQGEPVQIRVTVSNSGGRTGPFWVDLYINPSGIPSAANQPWNERCGLDPCKGISWYVGAGLDPGQSVTLSSLSYPDGFSIWDGTFVAGTTNLYAYVDSWNPGNAQGLAAESNEANNLAQLHGLSVTK